MHPLQECFLRRGAAQCGFCTPGMVLTSLDVVRRTGRPTREEIRYALVGNLCRCTGYAKILDAVEEYADLAVPGAVPGSVPDTVPDPGAERPPGVAAP
jgi:aerobic-type carbon monoxide dehydrogenase small subunit (CoxS/CutS family)